MSNSSSSSFVIGYNNEAEAREILFNLFEVGDETCILYPIVRDIITTLLRGEKPEPEDLDMSWLSLADEKMLEWQNKYETVLVGLVSNEDWDISSNILYSLAHINYETDALGLLKEQV